MSWSVTMIGKPESIVEALNDESARLDGQSKVEFDSILPALTALVRQNFANGEGFVEPVLLLEASGSGCVRNDTQVQRSAQVKLENFYARLV